MMIINHIMINKDKKEKKCIKNNQIKKQKNVLLNLK